MAREGEEAWRADWRYVKWVDSAVNEESRRRRRMMADRVWEQEQAEAEAGSGSEARARESRR
jgi:broad specificity phosphatase PhoE